VGELSRELFAAVWLLLITVDVLCLWGVFRSPFEVKRLWMENQIQLALEHRFRESVPNRWIFFDGGGSG